MITSRRTMVGTALIIAGTLFLLGAVGAVDFGPVIETYWPVLLMVLGIALLLKRKGGGPLFALPHPNPAAGAMGNVTGGFPGEKVNVSQIAGNVDIQVTSRAFKGGTASTIFGEVRVDCRQSELAEGDHTLALSSVFGASNVVIPEGAAVKVNAHTLFGDTKIFDQKRNGVPAEMTFEAPGYAAAGRRLHVDISQVFGSIRVRR